MKRKEIIQLNTYQAVFALLNEGRIPSVRLVVRKIGKGSFSTISPILSSLKKQTKNYKDLKPLIDYLEKQPMAQKFAIGKISDSLMQKLSDNIDKLEQEKLDLQKKALELEKVILERDYYKRLYESLLLERESFAKSTAESKSAEMAQLFDEIKAINLEHQRQQRELGGRLDEKLLEKEVMIVNLKVQIEKLKNPPPVEVKESQLEQRLRAANQTLILENENLVGELENLKKRLENA